MVMTFARNFWSRDTPGRWSLCKYAKDATSLGVDWDPAGSLYLGLLTFLDAAIAARGTPLSAFIWIQGERDSVFSNLAAAYGDNLAAFFARIRTRYGASLPIFYNQLSSQNANPYASQVRSGQAANANTTNNYMLTIDDLPLQSASPEHFTPPGYLELGRRYATAMTWTGTDSHA
jgi:hypothetical protein